MQETKKDTKRYIIYEDVMIEVRDVLMEYIDRIELETGSPYSSPYSLHLDKIRMVLHHFESGLYLIAAKKK